MELEPEIKVHGLKCNRSLPEGVPFVNNTVIDEPKYGIFFTDVFGDQAFQRWNDIHKVGVDSLVSYLVMALKIKTLENARFIRKLKKLIAEQPVQEKLQSKKVKLEAVGYKLRRQNRRVPFELRDEWPAQPRVVYLPILDINYFRHLLNILENYNLMDDEPLWATDHVIAPTLGSAITIPETVNEFAIKDIENKVVRLMLFPLSLTGKAKTWLDELNEGTIKTRDEL
ncbi:hypothetical protein Tco_0483838 [Tanacetum coccineum]